MYDFNSLVADVGGYLGLLLGESIYGIFGMVFLWMAKIISRKKKDTKVASIHELKVVESIQ